MAGNNLYVHFPFCRRKCSYCTLYSRTGIPRCDRDAYARSLAGPAKGVYDTAYFGGGSPALCDLSPLLENVAAAEFTVELHPLDVTADLLRKLADGGVNRISMGVQSLDRQTLVNMQRMYTPYDAAKAFELARNHFENCGIDVILGYPGDDASWFDSLSSWGLSHCSVYSLQNERNLKGTPDDETLLDMIANAASCLAKTGLERYEISNYAVPGRECRHNLAVWHGEDYKGIGEGAFGRTGLTRTKNAGTPSQSVTHTTPERDRIERRIFSLRTKHGLDASEFPEWGKTLEAFRSEKLLEREGSVYRLTARGTEVCDSILAELV